MAWYYEAWHALSEISAKEKITMLHRIKKLIENAVGYTREPSSLSKLSLDDQEIIKKIRREKLTYLSSQKLASLATTCHAIEKANLPGIFIEAGCALGGSSILIASLKRAERPFFIYDVFGMIPAPTAEDPQDVHNRYKVISGGESQGIGGDKYYGYQENLYETVRFNLRRFRINCEAQAVSLVKGLVQETMEINQPVAFAHVDVDWHDPVMTCLEQITPNLIVGGAIILDDYHDWGGCRKATDEYFRKTGDQFFLDDSAGSMKIIRKTHQSLRS